MIATSFDHPSQPSLTAAALLAFLALPAIAQEQNFTAGVDISDNSLSDADLFVTDTSVLDGNACIGNSCVENEVFDLESLAVFNDVTVSLEFKDSSGATFPDRDWRLRVNDVATLATGGIERFSIEDMSAGTIPFTLAGGAPENALWIDTDGSIGLGTSMPQGELHVVAPQPSLLLEDSSPAPGGWRLNGTSANFVVEQYPENTTPFFITKNAPHASLAISADGDIGMGTSTPEAPLEIVDASSFSFFRLTAAHAPVNRSVDVVFTQGPLGTGEFRYNIVDGDGPEMRLNADGDMVLDGTLTTAGSCSVGCDAVFDPSYPLPSIEEHHEQTLALGHLPNVGPTRDGEPWDVTDKMGRILNELEHAHLYIGQLDARLKAETSEKAAMARQIDTQAARINALMARLDALEARN